jgi:hypothetical protein
MQLALGQVQGLPDDRLPVYAPLAFQAGDDVVLDPLVDEEAPPLFQGLELPLQKGFAPERVISVVPAGRAVPRRSICRFADNNGAAGAW